jgi:hypothetical protein
VTVLDPCSIDGCGLPVFRRGWCSGHWHRWQRHGDPFAGGIKHGDGPRALAAVLLADTDDCVIWPNGKSGGFDGKSSGYGAVWLDGKQRTAHILVCEAVHGSRPANHEVAHSCGNPTCVNWRHLRWATHKENMADQLLHGTRVQGERCHNARLTPFDVRLIRRYSDEGWSRRDIANRIGVSRGAVKGVLGGTTWKWVD